MPFIPKITRVVQTCRACPAQWEGFLQDGRAFYARFRYGCLRVTAHATDPLMIDADVLFADVAEPDLLGGGEMEYIEFRNRLRTVGIDTPREMDHADLYHPHIVPALQTS